MRLFRSIVRAAARNPLLAALFCGIAAIAISDAAGWGFLWLPLLPSAVAVLVAAGEWRRSAGIEGEIADSDFGPAPGEKGRTRGFHWCLPFVLCSAAALALGWLHLREMRRIADFPLAGAVEEGRSVEVSGRGWVTSVRGGSALTLRVEEIAASGGPAVACDQRLPVWVRGRETVPEHGREFRFSGRLRPLEGPLAPGGFDAGKYFFRQCGALVQLEVEPGDRWKATGRLQGSALVRWAGRARNWMEGALRHRLRESDEEMVRVVLAMTLGMREDAPEELEESFRRSGTLHVFAVSGLHVGIVAGVFLLLCRSTGVPGRWAVAAVVPLVIFYAVLTGMRPSAMRAALMLSIFLAGYALLQRSRLLNSLGFAGLCLLVFDTQEIFLPGFQLSFAVLLAIGLLAEPLHRRLHGPLAVDAFVPRKFVSGWRRSADGVAQGVCGAVAVSTAAWVGSVGLLAWHFQGVAAAGLLANPFLVLVAAGIVTFAVVSALCAGLGLGWATALLNWANVGLATWLAGMVGFFSSLPGAYWHVDLGGVPAEERAWTVEGRKAEAETGDGSGEDGGRAPSFELAVMGVRGEGAGLLTWRGEKGTPRHWLVDSGGLRTYQRQVLPLLRSRGVNRLEGMVLSHGDIGHLGAAARALERFRPRVLAESALPNRSHAYPGVLRAVEERPLERLALEGGQVIEWGGGLRCRVFYPPAGERRGHSLADDRSLVLRFEQGTGENALRVLHSFDAGFAVEMELLESGADLSADVWVRGQHTRSPSGSERWLDAVAPRAVITGNAGFPAYERIPEEWRKRMEARGIRLFDLDRCGTVFVRARDGELGVESFRPGVEGLWISREERWR